MEINIDEVDAVCNQLSDGGYILGWNFLVQDISVVIKLKIRYW
ncbi:MAG: hypothetical protein V9F05_12745 [Chitinophagaceae bacterium]